MEIFFFFFHLSEEGGDPKEIVRRAHEAGVRFLLACGGSLQDSSSVRDFAEQYDDVYFAAGVHPHEADSFDGSIEPFRAFSLSPKFRAVGEIGIDTYYENAGLDKQKDTMRIMLDWALECKAPAIIHCRAADGCDDSYQVCYELLSAFAGKGGKFVLHCFAGTPEWMRKFAELGSFFGVGGMLTFRRADNIREVVMLMPEDRILLETDSPYLAPVPFRGRPNTPEYLPLVAHKLAELKGVPVDRIAELTTSNAFRLFENRSI